VSAATIFDGMIRRYIEIGLADAEIVDELVSLRSVRDTLYSRRSFSERVRELRGTTVGPPKDTGLTIDAIRAALIEWQGEWPPTQPEMVEPLGKEPRTIRLALSRAHTTWEKEIERASADRQ